MRPPIESVEVKTVPHESQRYDTVDDWIILGDKHLFMNVSRIRDPRSTAGVMIHGIAEAILCHFGGIKEADVFLFDTEFEMRRKPGDDSEPGDDPRAPYHKEHLVSDKLERLLIEALGLTWEEHCANIGALDDELDAKRFDGA